MEEFITLTKDIVREFLEDGECGHKEHFIGVIHSQQIMDLQFISLLFLEAPSLLLHIFNILLMVVVMLPFIQHQIKLLNIERQHPIHH